MSVDLERFARHLSLEGVGIKGQEKLGALRVACVANAPWAAALRMHLARLGVACVSEGADVVVRAADRAAPAGVARAASAGSDAETDVAERRDVGADGAGQVDFAPGVVTVCFADARPPAWRWLAALVAGEIALWHLGMRPAAYRLALAFPEFQVKGIDVEENNIDGAHG